MCSEKVVQSSSSSTAVLMPSKRSRLNQFFLCISRKSVKSVSHAGRDDHAGVMDGLQPQQLPGGVLLLSERPADVFQPPGRRRGLQVPLLDVLRRPAGRGLAPDGPGMVTINF